MSFVLPTFNLTVNLFRPPLVDYTIPTFNFQANLAMGRRILTAFLTVDDGSPRAQLLCPAGTDIRAAWNGANFDYVEVPAGSKRFYNVAWVDDMGKGFPNEHRYAIILQQFGSVIFTVQGLIPIPVPLP